MKKRVFTLFLVVMFMFTAALPVSASDANFYLDTYGQTYSTGLLQGTSASFLNVSNFGSDGVWFELTDQNNNPLGSGWLNADSSVTYSRWAHPDTQIDGSGSFNWNYWNLPPTNNTITSINMTVSCTGQCDVSGYIEVN